CDRLLADLDDRVAALAIADVRVQAVARDGVEIGSEARVAAIAFLALDRAEEGLLGQILGRVLDLAAEEPVDRVEVASEQLAARSFVRVAPGLEQLEVGLVGQAHPASLSQRLAQRTR